MFDILPKSDQAKISSILTKVDWILTVWVQLHQKVLGRIMQLPPSPLPVLAPASPSPPRPINTSMS